MQVQPYLFFSGNCEEALKFYKKALGAEELFRLPDKDGRIGHAELKIGDSVVMLADEYPTMKIVGPQTLGGTSVGLLVYVSDVDTIVGRALAQGAKLDRPIQDQFYGDRSGTLTDPFGHVWTVATHKEDVSPEEIDKRLAAMAASGGHQG